MQVQLLWQKWPAEASTWLAPVQQLQQQQEQVTMQHATSSCSCSVRWLSRLFCINVIIVAAGSAGCRYLKLIDSWIEKFGDIFPYLICCPLPVARCSCNAYSLARFLQLPLSRRRDMQKLEKMFSGTWPGALLLYIVHNFSPSPTAHPPPQNMLATLRLLSLLRVMLPNVFWLINVSHSTSSLSSSVTICVSFDMRSKDTHGRVV